MHGLLKLPWFANSNVSGARKLFFFFSVGFVYKLLLGYGLQLFAPWAKGSDFFAFGYLISTLLALKIHDKEIGIRVTRATLQTSLTAVVAASFVGFVLSFIPAQRMESNAGGEALAVEPAAEATLGDLLLRQRVVDYGVIGRERPPQPSGTQLAEFKTALLALKSYQREGASAQLQQARRRLRRLNYTISRIEERYLVVREVGVSRGWGTYIIDVRPESRLVVEIPAAIEQRGLIEAGLALFRDQQASALAVSSVQALENSAGRIDVTRNPGSFFHQLHQTFGARHALQVQLITRTTARELPGSRAPETSGPPGMPSQLLVKQQLPEDLRLQNLERLLGEVALRWESPGIPNVQRARSREGFAELYLNPDALRPLLARSHGQRGTPLRLDSRDGALSDYLLEKTALIRTAAGLDFRQPRLDELLFFDIEVLGPLLELAASGSISEWSEDALSELRYLNDLARGLGYHIVRFHDRARDQHYLILENTPGVRPFQPWGTVVMAPGGASSHFVQVPRPRYERQTLEAGTQLFQLLGARALLIAGSHPFVDPEGGSDVLSPRNQRSLFNLVHQVFVREAQGTPLLVTQVRGMGYQAGISTPSLLAFRDGLRPGAPPLPLRERLRDTLKAMGLDAQTVLGGEATAGYEVGSNAQTRYLDVAHGADFATVWITPAAREAFQLPFANRQQQLKFQALHIDTLHAALGEQLKRYRVSSASLPESVETLLEHYVETGNIVALSALQRRGHHLVRVLDSASRQAFLLVAQAGQPSSIMAVANLNPIGKHVVESTPERLQAQLERFVRRRAFLLRVRGDT
ncbi:hypothetical protein [Halomonas cibimaris]|uniref:hypothetical protein n=1 Tax=Halomonas cibimaris TaxID=657012 RepID=UPI0031E0983F